MGNRTSYPPLNRAGFANLHPRSGSKTDARARAERLAHFCLMKWPNTRPRVQGPPHLSALPSTLPTLAVMTAMLQYPTRRCPRTNTTAHHRHHHHYREHLQVPASTMTMTHKECMRPRRLLRAIQRWLPTRLSSLGHQADIRSLLLQIMGISQTSVEHHPSGRIASRPSIYLLASMWPAQILIVH